MSDLNRTRRPLIYVAGPYTQGLLDDNIRNIVELGDVLDRSFDCAPFLPHLFHFWELMSPRHYEEWLSLDLDMLERCDAIVRLAGESPGADREVKYAGELGIPVFEAAQYMGQDGRTAFIEFQEGFVEWRNEWTS